MPAAIKRRKLSTTAKAASSSANRPRGIDAFTRVSKGSSVTKSVIEKNYHADITVTPSQNYASTTRKRKLVVIEEDAEIAEDTSQILSASSRPKTKLLPRRRASEARPTPQTPQKLIRNCESPDSIETPTKGARGLLDRLFLSSTTPTRSSLNHDSSTSYILDPNTHPSPGQNPQDLPTELLDLINLHAAFLTASSLHYAHNGTHSPADLRMLCPNVARAWGKRSVTLEDIRRTLGVLNTNIGEDCSDHRISRLILSDYGHGKICIEIGTAAGKPGRIARPVNEDLLNGIFVRGLTAAWESRASTETEPKEFIGSLPLEAITTCSSFKISPMAAKGQRRLEDLKHGITITKEQEKSKCSVKEEATPSSIGAKPTLLERLRAKQQQLSSLPPPPSKEELDRKAALSRIEGVAAVLANLSTSRSVGQQRVSFTLPTVLGKLRDSLNTPMSKEEGETCLRLMAAEIAPDWVAIVKLGKMEALVVNRDARPRESSIRERVEHAT
ncbi:Uncharacterized protein BP5553_05110 [Venustampulla echinocandica]|uniref:DNA replication factor Cdt1 C-terminal domain-containing protein n=1 Tax=Venustampulla echinocandica TaxID=2656787 RepID=A0A370TQ67_9HELO|nr:Uncharacterized protein BP5553_05110 [Venustampulla echinocandica]RDL37677.1 Uncharacterized protein BP5553_05110 [Venustampulla echinocandica]